jgi:hypothetical protein
MRTLLAALSVVLAACTHTVVSKPFVAPTASAVAQSAVRDRPAQPVPELVAIDIYGTRQITREQVFAKYGQELRSLGAAWTSEDTSQIEAILAKLAAPGDFADVSPSLVGYYEPGGMKYYLTLDFVDRVDAARRMPFLPQPTGTCPDPAGLLADWSAYESKVVDLMGSKQMGSTRVECPAFHCLGDDTNPQVKRLADEFVARVPDHVAELAKILSDDHDGAHRAAAAFLLAYSKDGPALVELMVRAFRDSNAVVRNNAMRVVSDIAFYHAEIDVPLDPVIAALDYPATSDRNKAAAILDGLVERPGAVVNAPMIATRAGGTLLAMLRLEQPNNHNFAYRILKAISGQSFGERDYPAWEAWVQATARR